MASLPVPENIEEDAADLAGLLEPSTGWYRAWYAQLRLAEEVLRAERYRRALSVVGLRFEQAEAASLPNRQALFEALKQVAGRELRAVDLPAALGRQRFFVILPETDGAGARVVADRLRESLAAFAPAAGIACYPEDGRSVEDLLAAALA